MILNSYKKDGLDYIVIDNLYTDSELNAIKRELNELIPRLKPVETVDSAYLLESGYSKEKIYIKDCLSIWLDDVYIWDRTRSNILNMSRKLFNNKEITSFCTKVNAFFGHMEQSNVDFTLLNMYKSGEKYLSHIDSSMISVITLFEVGKVLEGGIKSALLCHNTQFDGAILAFRFGIIPGLYLDTLSMARATNGVEVGGSLAYLVEHYELGVKGTEVVQAKGKRLEDFSPTELSAYAGYCVNDVNLTYKLFGVLAPKFPQSEIDLIDLTLRMYTEPLLEVDDALLQARLEEVQQEKSELLQGLMVKLECETEECVRAKLASNKQFAEILQELGVIVPTKISPATGKETFALAKGDQGFLRFM
jgi:hypothetical protein